MFKILKIHTLFFFFFYKYSIVKQRLFCKYLNYYYKHSIRKKNKAGTLVQPLSNYLHVADFVSDVVTFTANYCIAPS